MKEWNEALMEVDNRGRDKEIGHDGDLAGRRMLLSKQQTSQV